MSGQPSRNDHPPTPTFVPSRCLRFGRLLDILSPFYFFHSRQLARFANHRPVFHTAPTLLHYSSFFSALGALLSVASFASSILRSNLRSSTSRVRTVRRARTRCGPQDRRRLCPPPFPALLSHLNPTTTSTLGRTRTSHYCPHHVRLRLCMQYNARLCRLLTGT